MGIRKYKPTSPGRRFGTVLDFSEITRTKREKSLCEPKKMTGGRNHHGRTTARFRGGGHKRAYRRIDFRRDKDGVPARVASIEYDPNRSANIALLNYVDGEKRYIIAPLGLEVGQQVLSGPNAEPRLGNSLPLGKIPPGLIVHNVELEPGGGAKLARSAGTYIRLTAKEGKYAILVLPSGEQRRVNINCRATLGQIGNLDWQHVTYGKAGRTRWHGRRPHNRGTSMNPVAHPMGGGEGRKAGGRHPCSPTGVLSKGGKTRKPGKTSNSLIIRKRRKKRKKR
ncbi:MAG: 50S ribosomal protein L2 [Planctomycetota bacterium]|nr:MAG: 50S ribosomal protein L2 [Planctomycetota bacterium]